MITWKNWCVNCEDKWIEHVDLLLLSLYSFTWSSFYTRYDNENQSAADKSTRDVRRVPSFSGPLMLPNRASANSLSAPIKSSSGTIFWRIMTSLFLLLCVSFSFCRDKSCKEVVSYQLVALSWGLTFFVIYFFLFYVRI